MSQRDSDEKVCSKCDSAFPATSEYFHTDKQKPDGLRPDCKACAGLRRRSVYLRRREKEIEKTKEYARSQPELTAERSHQRYIRSRERPGIIEMRRLKAKEWRNLNIDRARSYDREWVHKNRGAHVAKCALARARRRKAAPAWLSADHKRQMRDIYRDAAHLGAHVDHIIPIKGETVCGLHVPWNLQILSPKDNLQKGNRLVSA